MPWVYLLLAIAAFVVALKTTSPALMAVSLLAALGLLIAGVMSLLARRLDNTSRDVSVIIDPVELRRLREQAEARKLAASQSEPPQR
ncbi:MULTISPECIES: hypothetical protein [Lysobacter]|jgi:hypothetical protein|uniref:Transmembrane protein n=1 Tax=Lysobacter gummosus TaxID=262324 RepID=A0ABY3XEI9_9GAMM|nr:MULTISPECIES: hypothetical protein [Lysobacter]ALN89004.1 hypothetical protein LG3211_0014 [Lysobacter gummosus]UJB19023.1 hypothetical protein L1A79_22365 [Lysobacter capsici]UJQ27252.1 hypothetical protein L2D09_17520 [Lysobacter gummosus]UNP29721.1 hypothetical protein MOV92_00075 [Lysobacter gummosus]